MTAKRVDLHAIAHFLPQPQRPHLIMQDLSDVSCFVILL